MNIVNSKISHESLETVLDPAGYQQLMREFDDRMNPETGAPEFRHPLVALECSPEKGNYAWTAFFGQATDSLMRNARVRAQYGTVGQYREYTNNWLPVGGY